MLAGGHNADDAILLVDDIVVRYDTAAEVHRGANHERTARRTDPNPAAQEVNRGHKS